MTNAVRYALQCRSHTPRSILACATCVLTLQSGSDTVKVFENTSVVRLLYLLNPGLACLFQCVLPSTAFPIGQ